jgi:putative hydrolase of the HAD superfamily
VKHNPSIKNLIFDLGGVILDLSVDQTMEQFSALSGLDKQRVKDLYASTPGFEDYEKGLMNDKDFRDFVRHVFSVQSSDDEIDKCWNAMLLGLPIRKLNLLQSLKNNFSVYPPASTYQQ